MSQPEKIAYEDSVDYEVVETGGVCTLYVDSGEEEWGVRFNLCTPLDCLIADTHDDDGFADEEDRVTFDRMKFDLQLMLARIERVKYR